MTPPAVSVVIPTRDRHEWLRRAVASALAQEDVALEVIVVDDGCHAPVTAPAGVSVLRTPSAQGVAAARNRGIAAASAGWIAFLDDDDLWAPDKLARQLAQGLARRADFVFGSALVVDDSGIPLHLAAAAAPGTDLRTEMLRSNLVPGGCSNLIARADLLRELGGFDPAFSMLADWDLHVRLAAAGAGATIEDVVVAYTVHLANMARDDGIARDELLRFTDKHAGARAECGVSLDETWWLSWRLGAARGPGSDREAAALAWRLALRERSPGLAARAALLRLGGHRAVAAAERLRRPRARIAAPRWLAVSPPPYG